MLRDKDYEFIAKRLSEVSDRTFTITPDNGRALTADEYASVLSNNGVLATPCKNIGEALKLATDEARKRGTALCILGSLYTYVDVIKAYNNQIL